MDQITFLIFQLAVLIFSVMIHELSHGYVAEHRLLAEQLIGRQLLSNEVVNHKDRDTTNNQIGNLEVFDNNGEHIAMHVRTSFNRIERGRWGIVQ